MKYSVIVCDDDEVLAKNLAKNIKYAVSNFTDDNTVYENIEINLELVATTFEQVVSYVVANDIQNAIYFLDIELSQNSKAKNGVDLAEFIKKQDPNAQIIFVTAYDKYAPLTYRRRIGAIDYINKTLDSREMMQRLEETLTGAVQSINNLMKSGRKELIYKNGRRVNKVEDTTIYYLENSTSQHKVNLITETGVAEFRSNISKINEENDFLVKVSQSCVVNPNNINSIDFSKKTIKFPNGDEVVFARSCRKTV
ncbi:MAG: LytTR family DNA-binding domain-containing protein, partial [Lactobacillus paragasseri]|nr:LytTR family DNA-binding domain-containing protein [Lactobacillus paragasseri]